MIPQEIVCQTECQLPTLSTVMLCIISQTYMQDYREYIEFYLRSVSVERKRIMLLTREREGEQ